MNFQYRQLFLLSFLLIAFSHQLCAQDWRFTDSLSYARYLHTATKLADGRVLIVGGTITDGSSVDSVNNYHPPCEIYDPQTGTWSEAGYLIGPRRGHTATLLQDGRVLIAGGTGVGPASHPPSTNRNTICEIYDPATNSWDRTGALNQIRIYAVAVTMNDGRVLIVGGNATVNWREEIYDPATGTWKWTPSIGVGSVHHPPILLNDGRVLVSSTDSRPVQIDEKGGYRTHWYNSLRIFDPETETWSDPGWNGPVLQQYGVAPLKDGRLLIAGGYHWFQPLPYGGPFSRVTILFDPVTNEWAETDSLPEGICRGPYDTTIHLRSRLGYSPTTRLVTLKNGNVLALGGSDSSYRYAMPPTDVGLYYVNTQIYNRYTNQWRSAGLLNEERIGGTLTLLDDGRVLVAGGIGPTGTSRSCEVLESSGNSNY